jgi:hypothetical protein
VLSKPALNDSLFRSQGVLLVIKVIKAKRELLLPFLWIIIAVLIMIRVIRVRVVSNKRVRQ